MPDRLLVLGEKGSSSEFLLTQDVITIGRDPGNTLMLPDPLVSRRHARLSRKADAYYLEDLDSTDGTKVNGSPLSPHTPSKLVGGEAIHMGNTFLQYETGDDTLAGESLLGKTLTASQAATIQPRPWSSLNLKGKSGITVGRDRGNDLVLNHPAVSRFHTQIRFKESQWMIRDLGSTNRTFLNGSPLEGEQALHVGTKLQIGPYRLVLDSDQTLTAVSDFGNLRLDAIGLNKMVGKGTNLLHNISLSIKPKEFVVIAGVSGGGKSTLLDALNGFRPATQGQVLVNGHDLYRHFEAYRSEIGYVPQKDIVHLELSVEQALDYAARLRMPADTSLQERQNRIQEVLQQLGLSHRRQVPVKALSGGQLKRVSMGVELLTKPSLFFLDEATSGLDPGTEAEVMQLLRNLADQGSTILLITHATENVTLCDRVVFMAAGGRLAFFGSPSEALDYFKVEKFSDIYRKVERENKPEDWQNRFLQSSLYQHYVVEPQQSYTPIPPDSTRTLSAKQDPTRPSQGLSGWRQWLILTERNLALIARDRISLSLMLATAPILGFLIAAPWPPILLDPVEGDPNLTITMLFTTALVVVMMGSLSSMREIVKETDIFRRERMVGLLVIPYLLSKVSVSFVLALYQAAVVLPFLLWKLQPIAGSNLLGVYLTLAMAAFGGMALGLLVSALSPNQNVAPLLTIIVLVPQILFGGGLIPLSDLSPSTRLVNQITLTKWPFESLATLSGFGTDIERDSCWKKTKQERQELDDKQKKSCICFSEAVLTECRFPGIRDQSEDDQDISAPEPKSVKDPGEPPTQPKDPILLSEWADAMKQYQSKADAYAQYQKQFNEWKSKRTGAIAKREAIIETFERNYRPMFAVDLFHHGLKLGVLVLTLLGILLLVKRAAP